MSSARRVTGNLVCNKYRLGNAFGNGTHGLVRKARDIEEEDPRGWNLAAKLVALRDSYDFFDFEAEVAAMKSVQGHSNIIDLLAADICGDEAPYGVIVMEKGEMDLLEYMDDQGRLSVPQARELFFEICAAVAHCHHLKIAHRDIKPENIIMCGDKPKLADFGAAQDFYDVCDRYCQDQVGTRVYTAPEVQNPSKKGYDCVKGDIWAMGILLHVLLTGCWPYRKDTVDFKCELHIVENKFVDCPRALALLKSLLAKNPNKRPSMAKVLLDPFFLPDEYDINSNRRKISMSSKAPIKRRKRKPRSSSAASIYDEEKEEKEELTVPTPKKLSVATRIRKELRFQVLTSRFSSFRGRVTKENTTGSRN